MKRRGDGERAATGSARIKRASAACSKAEDELARARAELNQAKDAVFLAKRRDEILTWWAKTHSLHPERWPVGLRDEIERRVAELETEAEEYNKRLAEYSKTSLRAGGFSEFDIERVSRI